MSTKTTKIEWTDKTWNPITGCTKQSAGCQHCYAETMARRLKAMGLDKYQNGFQLTLHPSSEVTLTNLKVIVYGTGAASAITDVVDGVSYTVAWKGQGPAVPTGNVGSLTDRDVSYASEMNFDLRTNGTLGVTFDSDKKLCIPVTLAEVRRITVVGYNNGAVVFSKTSTVADTQLERNRIYPVAAIQVN